MKKPAWTVDVERKTIKKQEIHFVPSYVYVRAAIVVVVVVVVVE